MFGLRENECGDLLSTDVLAFVQFGSPSKACLSIVLEPVDFLLVVHSFVTHSAASLRSSYFVHCYRYPHKTPIRCLLSCLVLSCLVFFTHTLSLSVWSLTTAFQAHVASSNRSFGIIHNGFLS